MDNKKINEITFAWDPAAFKGKGYWFVYDKKTSQLGRAASKIEAAKLGKAPDTTPKSKDVYKMSYQKADRIKETGLLSLIARKKFEEGQSLGASIKGAISDKFKAKVKRTKRAFDPLNLVRVLTGNGVIGKSLRTIAGRTMGRDDEDIKYFGGYKRKGNRSSAEPMVTHIGSGKITPIASGDGVADAVTKLYSLIKNNFDEKIKKSELQKNFEEGKNEKQQKRHDELIKALGGISKGSDKKEGKKNEGGLLDFVTNLLNKFKDMLKPILDIWSDVKSFFKNDLWKNLLKYGKYLIEFLAAPEVVLLAAIAGSVLIAAWLGKKAAEWLEAKQEATAREKGGEKAVQALKEQREAIDHTQGEIGVVQNEDADAAKIKYDAAVKEKQEIIGQYLVDKGYKRYEKTILGKPQGKYTFENTQGNPPSDKLLQEANAYADKQLSASKIMETNTTPASTPVATTTPMPSTGAGGGRGGMGGPTAEQSSSATTTAEQSSSATTTATPAPSVSPSGGQMQAATKENIDQQTEASMSSGKSIVINKTNNSSIGGKSESGSIGESAVRNDDDSLLKAQKQSLRIV